VPWLEYISAPPGAPPLLARNQLIKTSRKPFKASVAMSEQFPMKVTHGMISFVHPDSLNSETSFFLNPRPKNKIYGNTLISVETGFFFHQKLNDIKKNFFCLLLFKGTFTLFFKDKIVKS
jgi:hypothetical protein